MTKVVNVRVKFIRPKYNNLEKWCNDPNNIYIGRRGVVFITNGKKGEENYERRRYPQKDSTFANPYKVGKHGTRKQVIKKYKTYMKRKIKSGEINMEQIEELKGKNLGCWCAPHACHGDILLEILNEME